MAPRPAQNPAPAPASAPTPALAPAPIVLAPPQPAETATELGQATQSQQTDEIIVMDPKLPWTYKRVEALLDTEYNSDNSNKSVICDIIAMYLKGQKILYTEAKTVCEQRMNYLMLPAIFITSACSILSLVLKDYGFGGTIVSSLNGFNAFLLALISYLKLDAKAEAHRTSAYKFDKMQSQLEFSSGKSMFMEMTYDDMVKMINETEANVREIKETNKFILPEDIRIQFPRLCNMNVFAEVKKVQNLEMQKANELKDVLNALAVGENDELLAKRQYLVEEIIALKDDYLQIDGLFEREMRLHQERIRRGCQMCGWLKT